MRKNTVLILLSVFVLICSYNLFYSWSRLSTDSMLNTMKPEERTNWFKDKDNYDGYKKDRENSISLGLDLQGGMFVTLEVGVEEVIKGLAYNPNDSLLNQALAMASKDKVTSQDHFVNLFVKNLKKIAPNVRLATLFANNDKKIGFDTGDEQVKAMLIAESDGSIDRTFEVIRKRIDQFGVASPTIQKYGTNRILVELPGVKDSDRVRKLLKGTARLEFWPTYTIVEAYPVLNKINDEMKKSAGIVSADTLKTQEEKQDSAKTEQDTTKKDTAAKDTGKNKDAGLTDDQKREKFQKENPFFAKLSPPNTQNFSGNEPIVGYSLISDTAAVNMMLAKEECRKFIPDDMKFFWTAKPEQEGGQYLTLIAIKSNRDNKAPLDGERVTDARQDYDPTSKQPIVSMTMDAEGSRKWRKMTTDYLKKSVAIVLDNMVYSYPTVQNVIASGNSQISGNFTVDEAKDLSNLLKSGKLPAPARIEAEEVVGPSLGEATINSGLISFFIGFLVVIAFVSAYYKTAGVLASVALIFNLFFIMGISSAFQVVMTLPGIAGIVLTMGMAVDANILVYERVREELAAGRSMKMAISEGFRKAFSAILDGNVTTFLTGLILFYFGTGPIKGFAVTLMIGIITTLVAALLVTRYIIEFYIGSEERAMSLQFGSPAVAKFFNERNYNFIATRKLSYLIAGTMMVLFLGSIATKGFKLGVDFQGGRQYIVEFNSSNFNVDQAREDLTAAFNNNMPVIKTVGNKNQLMITTNYLINEKDSDDKVNEAVMTGLNKRFSAAKPSIVKSTKVGPTIASDIQIGAIYSVIFSLLVIFLYILVRFGRWQYSIGAIASLLFNVFTVLGIFSILGWLDIMPFSVELDQSIIAAVLTVVGYDINDTVVVYDRIRELDTEHHNKKMTPAEIFNLGINQTLSRTVITGVTTIASSFILFFFGGEVIQGFMLSMIIGFIVGVFTSIFIACPISVDLLVRSHNESIPNS